MEFITDCQIEIKKISKSNIYIMERFELENSREFKAAMELENALNDMCFDYKKFAESIKYFHPTL